MSNVVRFWLLCLLIVFAAFHTHAQILTNPTEAWAQSKQSNKPVLLVFAGSDWCVPCIRFEKKILSDSSFQKYAAAHIVILKADFPQKKKISEALRTQYESLSEQYNPQGLFPHIVLLSPEKAVLGDIVYNQQSPSEFIVTLKQVAK